MTSRVVVALYALLLSGCATVLNGTRQAIEVSSEPPGATVTAGDLHVVTPGVLQLPRKAREIELRFTKQGYRDESVTLRRRTSGRFWLNLIAVPVGAGAGAAVSGSRSSGFSVFERARDGAVAGGLALPAASVAVDLLSGGAYRLDPPRVHVSLRFTLHCPRISIPHSRHASTETE